MEDQIKNNILNIIIISLIVLGFVFVGIKLAKDDEAMIQNKSKECVEKGYEIKTVYDKIGEKYYVCNIEK